LNGAKRLDSLTASELLALSDAPIMVVLDGVSRLASRHWQDAVKAARLGDLGRARRSLEALDRLDGGETTWLADLGRRTLDNGRITRIQVHGLEAPDIICYLPVAEFVAGQEDWAPLLERWRSESGTDLKAWIKNTYGVA